MSDVDVAPAGSQPVVLTDIEYRYKETLAVDRVSLSVDSGEFVTLLGPSGSGKTTLLRIVAGLITPTAGRVVIGSRDVTNVSAQRRGVGMVFQNYALFPHMSVGDNIAYPLTLRRVPKAERARRVDEALERVNLSGMSKRRPSALSGGQQQRVAVARALVYEPAVILMDEPLGALDRQLRRHMQVELRQLQQQLGLTCIFVTHDQEEALTMSDRVGVMNHGRLLQLDTPMNLYRRPADAFVADFVGDTNFFEGKVVGTPGADQAVHSHSGLRIPLVVDAGVDDGARIVVGVRPESICFAAANGTTSFSAEAVVEQVRFVGSLLHVTARLHSGDRIEVQSSISDRLETSIGETVTVSWQASDQILHPVDPV